MRVVIILGKEHSISNDNKSIQVSILNRRYGKKEKLARHLNLYENPISWITQLRFMCGLSIVIVIRMNE